MTSGGERQGANGGRSGSLLPVFLEEAQAQLREWGLLQLELSEHPTEKSAEGLRTILRALRGASSGIGLEYFSAFARALGECFEIVAESGLARKSAELADCLALLADGRNLLLDWCAGLRLDPGYEPDLGALISRISRINPTAAIENARRGGAARSETAKTLGAILVENREATPEQVERAVELQERRLGQVMIDEGMVSEEAVKRALSAQKSDPVKKAGEQVRVPAVRIDSLLKAVGELSIQQSIVWYSRQTGSLESKAAQNAILLSSKIIKEVQAQVMALRLQPVKTLFQRLERVARDVSVSQSKSLETRVEGTEVDLDKAVIEKITDPLIHMVRNACDHGIESPEERLSRGKPEKATLRIEATQDTSDVMITMADDGRGMDPGRILRKAVEKGFVSASAQLEPWEILDLIFLPGFSTAEAVTEFSGRGVGMDVVKQVVTDLGGSITIASEPGTGTTFTIHIPTSVSLVDAVVFTVEGLRYVVPMRELVEVINLAGLRMEGSEERGFMARLRGDVVPVAHLRDFLPRSSAPEPGLGAVAGAIPGRRPALLVRTEFGVIAFEVDGVSGQQQVVVRALTENMAGIPACAGGTILGDGEPGVILGLSGIAREYFQKLRGKEVTP